MELQRPERLSDDYWEAIVRHRDRLVRQPADDLGATIGLCKDLAECVAKVVFAAASEPGASGFEQKLKKASELLSKAKPSTEGDSSIAKVSNGVWQSVQAIGTAAQGHTELRNSFGVGHGQALVPNIAPEDAALVRVFTEGWVTWALARLDRLLSNDVSVLIDDLTQQNFTRGKLRERMNMVDWKNLSAEEQERLGYAVAHRGARRKTFVVAWDGLDPDQWDSDWPDAYLVGVARGLLVDPDGALDPVRVDVLYDVALRLGEPQCERLLDEIEGYPVARHIAADYELKSKVWADVWELRQMGHSGLAAKWERLAGRFFESF